MPTNAPLITLISSQARCRGIFFFPCLSFSRLSAAASPFRPFCTPVRCLPLKLPFTRLFLARYPQFCPLIGAHLLHRRAQDRRSPSCSFHKTLRSCRLAYLAGSPAFRHSSGVHLLVLKVSLSPWSRGVERERRGEGAAAACGNYSRLLGSVID